MADLEQIVDTLRTSEARREGKSALKHLGFFSCTSRLDIKHVPFHEPCLILVTRGRKTVFDSGAPVVCDRGEIITVPGPYSYDLRNEPDARTRQYKALVIPFKAELLDRLTRGYHLIHEVPRKPVGVLRFQSDETIHAAIAHYLTTLEDDKLLLHRLMEILLLLATRNPALLCYPLRSQDWAARVRATVAKDLAQVWEMEQVCARLATSESTLRRNLAREGTSFREVVAELRLGSALMQLLQTDYPVYRVAYDCGYQSVSRFTRNFHRRFGLTPTEIRRSMHASEQLLNGSEQL